MEDSTVVIKVKYGDMLRRFNAQIVDNKLILNMDGLREKILSLFSFTPDTELMLTYVDEDGDVVALVDDDDLHDVMKQELNPLRITVKANDEKSGFQNNESSASSTPLRSPRVQQPLPNLNSGISEILRKVPDPLRGTLIKLSNDLTSKATSSAPGISELVDVLSKVSLSYLGPPSEPQTGVKSSKMAGVPESSTSSSETKNSEPLEKVGPETIMERNEVKSHNEASSFDFSAVAAALESQNKNVAHPGNDSLRNLTPAYPESCAPSNAVGKKSKLKKLLKSSSGKPQLMGDFPAVANIGEKVVESCIASTFFPPVVDKNLSGKGVCNHSEPKLGVSGNVSASDPTTGDNVNDKTRSGGKSPASIWAPHLGATNFGSYCSPITAHDCPFSGTAMGLISAAPPYPADPILSRGIIIQNDGSGNVFHRGVRCDGCGIHPIVGPRFKSKVKLDYDLCRICFEKYGNSNDYIRMERPAVLHPMPFKGIRDARTQGPMLSHAYRGSKVKLCPMKLDSRFIQDVNIFDGTIMSPSTPFTKIWRMRNNGTLMWPSKTQLVWIGGDKLSNALSVEVQIPAAGLLIDQELDIAVDFISPDLPGRYISYWRMASPTGQKFGQRVWVLIQVDASVKEAPRESVRDLNLNLPPVSSGLTGPEIINVDLEVVEETRPVVANNSKKIVESGKPEADQESKFPINDSLLVGNGASTSIPSSSTAPSASYPIIDLSDVPPSPSNMSPSVLFSIPPPPPPPLPLPLPTAPVASTPQSAVDHPGKNHQMEEELLKELEEMGFKQVDLNKEVLRLNEYDLEQAVDDLCGVAEWDPILEELKEMGFCDIETNKMLLKKNNGSIKRVVMDLIAGENI